MATQRNEPGEIEPRADVRIISDQSAEIDDAFMRSLGNISGNVFEDALALSEQLYGDVKTFADEMGTGFAILPNDDKAKLEGQRCLFLKWKFTDGDYGLYVNAAVVTPDGGKYILNDGSSGIYQQLKELSERTGRFGGFVAERGLRSSSYATCNGCGRPRDSREDVCENVLSNGHECGDTDTKRGMGVTYYVDLAVPA